MADSDRQGSNVDQATVDAILLEVDYPATRDDLVAAAEDIDADEAVIVLFQDLPDDEYESDDEVLRAISERRSLDEDDDEL